MKHGHVSITHGASIGVQIFGLSQKVELELNAQRDLVHLARETSARAICQDEPCLVAMTANGAKKSEKILEEINASLSSFEKTGNTLDWREERNALYPLSRADFLGITGSLRNVSKLVGDIKGEGKELEYRNILALMNDSLYGLFPELFQSTTSYGHVYPSEWIQTSPYAALAHSKMTFYASPTIQKKQAILLLGAPCVGKSTQTERILKQLPDVMCVSTGNLVRKLKAKKAAGLLPLTQIEQYAAE